jgi:hypothetical protein
LSESKAFPARRAIAKYFREPPPAAPDDLGLVLRYAGRDIFLPASIVVEITPALASSSLPGAPGLGVAFWRGRALEVRGLGPVARSFVLIRGRQAEFFLVAETLPAAISQALAGNVELYAEEA